MVNMKRYTPSNKRFQKHTQSFVEGKTMKGHLNKDKDDTKKAKGELVRIIKAKIYEDGWEVKKDKKTYACTYGDNIIYIPPCKETEMYYIPKEKCEVEFTTGSKINTITRINNYKKRPIEMDNQGITLKGDGRAGISISGDSTKVSGDIVVDTKKEKDLPDEISVTDLYKKVQVLEEKVSDNNDG